MNGKTKLVCGAVGIAALILALAGCGSSSKSDGEVAVDRAMTPGVEYSVSASDRLVVTSSEPAEILVRHSVSPDQRTVTLVAGSAELLQ